MFGQFLKLNLFPLHPYSSRQVTIFRLLYIHVQEMGLIFSDTDFDKKPDANNVPGHWFSVR